MIFTIDQLNYIKGQAEAVRKTLESQVIHGYAPEMQVELIAMALREACSMGRAIALDEVSSTPWEYHLATVGVEHRDGASFHLNVLGELGWEPLMCSESWVMLRRRKAVADIAAEEKAK